MPVDLPAAIQAYFAAKKDNDVDAMLASFGDAAVVRDEGKEMRGRAAIRAWIDGTNAKYRYTVEVIGLSEGATTTDVRCRLTGEFPGSPVEVTYSFGLGGGSIIRLEIS